MGKEQEKRKEAKKDEQKYLTLKQQIFKSSSQQEALAQAHQLQGVPP